MNFKSGRAWSILRYYYKVQLEILTKTTKHVNQDSQVSWSIYKLETRLCETRKLISIHQDFRYISCSVRFATRTQYSVRVLPLSSHCKSRSHKPCWRVDSGTHPCSLVMLSIHIHPHLHAPTSSCLDILVLFEIVAVTTKIASFQDSTPCDRYRRFGGTYCRNRQGRRSSWICRGKNTPIRFRTITQSLKIERRFRQAVP
jgi:hypothetical protein